MDSQDVEVAPAISLDELARRVRDLEAQNRVMKPVGAVVTAWASPSFFLAPTTGALLLLLGAILAAYSNLLFRFGHRRHCRAQHRRATPETGIRRGKGCGLSRRWRADANAHLEAGARTVIVTITGT